MHDLMNQIITPEVKTAFMLIIILLGVLYVISIIWVIRDSYLRGANPVIWGVVSLVPYLGAFAYSMMRPPMLLSDKDEQAIDFALKKRELMKYGECAKCGYPVENEYLMCPNCGTQLKNECRSCGHALKPEWKVCPYCCTPVGR
ncbi:MAG: zinc ribbon domain-containing protein [Coriobacteriales bacterium]|jgi:RNA polymerase subunit RPABC4/transcription elongation factor Spt4|nr:zinc ribbon domain-containing protein [Coriobacteriales bacterium]